MVTFCASFPHENGGKAGMVSANIAPIPAFLAGRAFPCMGMPFGKRDVHVAKPLPYPPLPGEQPQGLRRESTGE